MSVELLEAERHSEFSRGNVPAIKLEDLLVAELHILMLIRRDLRSLFDSMCTEPVDDRIVDGVCVNHESTPALLPVYSPVLEPTLD